MRIISLILMAATECFAVSLPTPAEFMEIPYYLEVESMRGSGFNFRSTNSTFLITAKHVLYDMKKPSPHPLHGTNMLVISWGSGTSQSNAYRLDLRLLESNGDIKVHPIRDLAAVRLISHTNNALGALVPGCSLLSLGKSVGVNHIGNVKRLDAITNFSHVYVFGYPAVGSVTVPHQLNPRRPLTRRGGIADIDRDRKLIVADASVFGGNSGGPLVEWRETVSFSGTTLSFSGEYSIIGVVTQFVPYEEFWEHHQFGLLNRSWQNSGYAVVEPMDFALEILWD